MRNSLSMIEGWGGGLGFLSLIVRYWGDYQATSVVFIKFKKRIIYQIKNPNKK